MLFPTFSRLDDRYDIAIVSSFGDFIPGDILSQFARYDSVITVAIIIKKTTISAPTFFLPIYQQNCD